MDVSKKVKATYNLERKKYISVTSCLLKNKRISFGHNSQKKIGSLSQSRKKIGTRSKAKEKCHEATLC